MLITTHYIEEAKQADQVAFIYRGICLEQNTPEKLLIKYNCQTLEEVSFRACCNHDVITSSKPNFTTPIINDTKKLFDLKTNHLKMSMSHMIALMWKLSTQIKSNVLFLIMFVAFPIIPMVLLPYCYGPPKNIPIGVIDNDLTNFTRSFVNSYNQERINVRLYDDVDQGISSVERGKNFYFAEIPEGLTDKLKRIQQGHLDDLFDDDMDDENVTLAPIDGMGSFAFFSNRRSGNDSIKLYLDITNVIPTYYAIFETFMAFRKASRSNQETFSSSKMRSTMSNLFAIKVEEPIYGSFDVEQKDSNVCGQLILMIFSHALMFSAFMLNSERGTGVKYRDRVTGITKLEVITAVTLFDAFCCMFTTTALLISVHFFYENLLSRYVERKQGFEGYTIPIDPKRELDIP